jgi:hypothetical protein
MEIEIKIGKRASDLRIKHFKVIQEPSFTDEPTINEMIQVIHLYSNVSVNKIKMYKQSDIVKMYIAIANQFSKLKMSDTPPKEVTYNGVTYSLIDPAKVGIGWHQDFKNCTMSNPTMLASMFYIPKGIIYGDEDENGNLKTTIRERSPIFAEHMELQTFIECCAFFLRKTEKSMRISMAKEKSQMIATRIIKAMHLNKKESSIGKK